MLCVCDCVFDVVQYCVCLLRVLDVAIWFHLLCVCICSVVLFECFNLLCLFLLMRYCLFECRLYVCVLFVLYLFLVCVCLHVDV